MSSKTGAKAWSMGRRMAVWYAGSAAVLLLVATTGLYLTIASSLDAEADQFLVYSVEYLSKYNHSEVSYDRTRELGLLGRYRHYMAFALIPALAASAVAGVTIARRGLRPVGEIAATARRIGPERLDERIAADGLPADLDDLARTFNVMLDRLQGSFGRLERFSGDIAHELRTPVHAIRNVAEVALATSRTREDDREALAACLDSAGHLARLIERLLFLARADDPRTVLELEVFDLAGELAAVREFYEPAAAGLELAVVAPSHLIFRLDRTLLQRALGNLLTNAMAHTPEGGRVVVSASVEAGTLVVAVSDTGVGIAAEHLPHIFDRFYRPDDATPRPPTRFHPDRAPGRDLDHRHPDRPAPTGRPGHPRGRPACPVHEQSEATRPGRPQLRVRQRVLPDGLSGKNSFVQCRLDHSGRL